MYPNLSNSNTHNVALKDTGNDEINGGKDSAIFSNRDVKDNPLVEFKPLKQTELGQFDDKTLSKQFRFPHKTFWCIFVLDHIRVLRDLLEKPYPLQTFQYSHFRWRGERDMVEILIFLLMWQ